MKLLREILIIFSLFFSNSLAQFSFESEYENYYDDNIYNNYLKTKDWIHSLTLSADYNLESEVNNLNFYWIGNYSYYQKNIFKTSATNRFGLANTYLLGESENPVNIGINYTYRKNRDDFALFDLEQYSFYSNYKHSFDKSEFVQV
ncbi:MAG: hypothetical protein N3A61_07745, partial [Ignavibacteria bacterium]|nr:hypothetical protein [Ignavibacteria bacterium]